MDAESELNAVESTTSSQLAQHARSDSAVDRTCVYSRPQRRRHVAACQCGSLFDENPAVTDRLICRSACLSGVSKRHRDETLLCKQTDSRGLHGRTSLNRHTQRRADQTSCTCTISRRLTCDLSTQRSSISRYSTPARHLCEAPMYE